MALFLYKNLNRYGDVLYKYKIQDVNFDYSYKSLQLHKIEPSKESQIVVIQFSLSQHINTVPSDAVLEEIAKCIVEQNGVNVVSSVYFYAEKDNSLQNLFAYNNQLKYINDFKSNRLNGAIIVIKVKMNDTNYYVFEKDSRFFLSLSRENGFFRNIMFFTGENIYEDVLNFLQNNLKLNAYRLSLIGTYEAHNVFFLFGKWHQTSNIYLVELKPSDVTIINSIVGETTSVKRILVDPKNPRKVVCKFIDNEDSERKQLFNRQDTYEQNSYIQDEVNFIPNDYSKHHFAIVNFIESNLKKTERHFNYDDDFRVHLKLDKDSSVN